MAQKAQKAQKIPDITNQALIQSIYEDTLSTLLIVTRVVGLGMAIIGPSVWRAQTSPLPLVIGISLFILSWLVRIVWKRFGYNPAIIVWICGTIASLAPTIAIYGLLSNSYVYATPLIIATTVLLLRPLYGAIAAVLTTVLLALIALVTGHRSDLWSTQFLSLVILTYGGAGISWLASRNLLTAIEWAYSSYQDVQRREAQLFESEQQLQRAFRETAYLNERLVISHREIDAARAAAEEANRLKSQFLRMMSHELRTPLNGIIGLSYILLQQIKGPLNTEQRDYVNRIYDSGEHLSRLINDILDHAKLEAGRLDLMIEPIELAPICDDVLFMASTLLHGKPVRLHTELAPDLPLIQADRLRLSQILINLTSNAVKYTDSGDISIRAFIQNDPSTITVEVVDTGVGIPAQYLDQIFEEYRQVDTPGRNASGTGLGLPICRMLVELLGGRIWVSSQPGKGSVFSFTVPAVVAPAITDGESQAAESSEVVISPLVELPIVVE